jgi:AraC-like DNA-binding protein
LAKIALELEQALARRKVEGGPGTPEPRVLAQGDGWTVSDVICTCGPRDRPFEEQHSRISIAVVAAGTFQYRSENGCELMMPGSLLLGNAGEYFECGHGHGAGDRCIAFQYTPGYFDSIGANRGNSFARFRIARVPPQRTFSPMIASVCARLVQRDLTTWEEISILLAARMGEILPDASCSVANPPAGAAARVSQVIRMIERSPESQLDFHSLAREARLSPYHFIRTFQRLTGVTPHQYILRVRLREAVLRLLDPQSKILDVALDCGFGDVSNFNRCFRAEFGVSPRGYRSNGSVGLVSELLE